MALLWITVAVLFNEWSVSWWLGVPAIGPAARTLLFSLDAVHLGWAVVTLRQHTRNWTLNANLILITGFALLVALEVTLRLYPRLLGHEFANGVLTKYTTEAQGIYYLDPIQHMNFMIPNYRTEMYYNGFRWSHATDAYGFRNPITRIEADILLLGDSFIYGHGVDIENTVGWYVEKLTGQRVMNLARQGDCTLQQAYLLTTYLPQFRPATVLYFFTDNDISDLYFYRTDAELTGMLERPITFAPNGTEGVRKDGLRPSLASAVSALYVVRIGNWWRYQSWKGDFSKRIADEQRYYERGVTRVALHQDGNSLYGRLSATTRCASHHHSHYGGLSGTPGHLGALCA